MGFLFLPWLLGDSGVNLMLSPVMILMFATGISFDFYQNFYVHFLIPLAYNSFCDVNWPVFFIEKLEGIIKKGNPIKKKKPRLMVERISNTPLCLQWVGCVFTVWFSWYHTLPDHLPPWSCVFSEILFKKNTALGLILEAAEWGFPYPSSPPFSF